MSDNNHQSLAFDEVAKRFADSEQALSQAQKRLHGLIEAEEGAAASARSLQESAEAVKTLAQNAGIAVEDLASAQAEARAALEAGASFLNGSELSELKEAVAGIDQRLVTVETQVLARLEELTKAVAGIDSRFEPLESRMLVAEEARESARAAHEEIDAVNEEMGAVKDVLPWRSRRKLESRQQAK